MTHHLMRYFEYYHLSPQLQAISMPFHDLAASRDSRLAPSDEKNMALRKLLEAKDCAVRAAFE